MKIKVLLVMSVITFLIFIIYLSNIDNKIYYVSINDTTNTSYDTYVASYLKKINKLETHIQKFSYNDMRITDLIKSIEENKIINLNKKEITIKHALIKADLLTLFLGNAELKYKIDTTNYLNIDDLYDYVDEEINDMNKLIALIRKYCKEDIILIGTYYESDWKDLNKIVNYYNKKLEELLNKYEVTFIDINKEMKNQTNMYETNEIYPNKKGDLYIGKMLEKSLNKNILNIK